MTNPISFVKNFLSMMSDYTFLSSIDNIDFRNHRVTIRTGYWKQLVVFLKGHFPLDDSRIGHTLTIIKGCFLDRFAQVSATKLKQYMLNKLFNSFFDFKNLLFYVEFYLKNSNKVDKSKFLELRKLKFYEKKANKHRIHQQRYLERKLRNEELRIEAETAEFMANYTPPSSDDDYQSYTEESNIPSDSEDLPDRNLDESSSDDSSDDDNDPDQAINDESGSVDADHNDNDNYETHSNISNSSYQSLTNYGTPNFQLSDYKFRLEYGLSKQDYYEDVLHIPPPNFLASGSNSSNTVASSSVDNASRPTFPRSMFKSKRKHSF